MLNLVWPIFIIISFSYAIFSGNLQNLNVSIFDSVENAVNLSITMLGTMCLWSGIINVATNTKIMEIMNAAQSAEYKKLIVAGEPLSKKEQKELKKSESPAT